jgi:glutaredoxin
MEIAGAPCRLRKNLAMPRVVLYAAAGCHLCERARAVLDAEGVAFEEVDITGEPELEQRYREWLPVVEIDGERAFVYFVQPEGLRRKLASQSST